MASLVWFCFVFGTIFKVQLFSVGFPLGAAVALYVVFFVVLVFLECVLLCCELLSLD